MSKVVRYWIPIDRGFDFPSKVVDLLHEMLDGAFPEWWSEVYEFPDTDLMDKGDVILYLWLNREDIDKGYPCDYKIWMGRWIYHPRFRGTWYIYDTDFLARKLEQIVDYETTPVET